MIAYKLFLVRKDGTIGSLFMNAKARLPMNQWMVAQYHEKKGFSPRPGWHCTYIPNAPHLSLVDRS